MARVLGVGGVFFKAIDPAGLARWYQEWLKMEIEEYNGASFHPSTMPEKGLTVWGPFDENTTYFDPSKREFMFNLVVDDLDGALKQVQEGGATLAGEVQEYDYGRFGWFIDPEGNKVELWEPA